MDTLKNGFGTQFNGFGFDTPLYPGYSTTYPTWDTKIPSPLGAKSFPWGLNSSVNPLPPVVTSQPMCFTASSGASSMTSSMVPNMNMPYSMANMSAAAAGMTPGGATCPYGSMNSPYFYPSRDTCSSSIASLRLKAKHHTGLGYPPVTNRQPPSLAACQYAGSLGNSVSPTLPI